MMRFALTVRMAMLAMLLLVGGLANAAKSATQIELSNLCPPSFIKIRNACHLQSQYLQYASSQNAGVGGLKTGLPRFRDGFSPQQIDLGRYLFFDRALSGNSSVACASCHVPELGFSDGKPRSRGMDGHEVARNAPSLWNVAFLSRFFWDGRSDSLEAQMQGPLYDAREMGNTREGLLGKLSASPEYRRLFAIAYPDSRSGLQLKHIYNALAAFETSLVSLNSRYDLYAQGFHDALSPNEVVGMNVFRSFVARCAECHTPPLFTNQQIAVIGTPEPGGRSFDVGAEKVSKEPTLRGGFKVPSLRNVALTAPYEHSGKFSTLHAAVEFYNLGRGHAVPKGEKLTLHWHIWEPHLSAAEINSVVDFLGALTDESFRPERPQSLPSGLNPIPLVAITSSRIQSIKDTP